MSYGELGHEMYGEANKHAGLIALIIMIVIICLMAMVIIPHAVRRHKITVLEKKLYAPSEAREKTF